MKKKISPKTQITKRRFNVLFAVLILISTLILGIGYAQVSGIDLTVDGSANAIQQNGLIITDVHYVSGVGVTPGDSSINSYYQTLLDSTIVLGGEGSSITYEVTIQNISDIKKTFRDVLYSSDFYDNENIEIVLNGLNHGDMLRPGESVTFQITYQYSDSTNNPTLNSLINFCFDNYIPKRYFELPPQCHYSGSLATITGEGCEEYADKNYVDTGVALFSEDNYLEDFDVSFDIVHYAVGEQQAGMDNQNTLMNAKLEVESRGYPGFVLRRNTSNAMLEITTGAGTGGPRGTRISNTISGSTSHFRIVRINHVMYYSVDNGPLLFFQDTTNFNDPFDTTVTFGASIKGDGTPFRFFTGDLRNIIVNVAPIDDSEFYTVKYDANGGNNGTSYLLGPNESAPSIPSVSRSGYWFGGWFDAPSGGNQVTPSTAPGTNTTYYAHWHKSVQSISATPSTLNLEIGQSGSFTITNAAQIEETWTYSSTKTSIITVDSDGVATAVGAGTAYVRLRGQSSNQNKDLKVVVTDPNA